MMRDARRLTTVRAHDARRCRLHQVRALFVSWQAILDAGSDPRLGDLDAGV